MPYLERAATWTAALSATTGAGCMAGLLSGVMLRPHVLIAAEAAAAAGLLSLLAAALADYFRARRRPGIDAAAGSPAVERAASGHRRRDVLIERLNIDEPRICSQYAIPCTCWSMCGGCAEQAGNAHTIAADAGSADTGLRVIHRSGMDNCPFRFVAPASGSAPR